MIVYEIHTTDAKGYSRGFVRVNDTLTKVTVAVGDSDVEMSAEEALELAAALTDTAEVVASRPLP